MRHALLDHSGKVLLEQEAHEFEDAIVAKLRARQGGWKRRELADRVERQVREAFREVEVEFKQRSTRV